MADPAKAELLTTLGKVVRGLSALFWAIPLTLVAYVQTGARVRWLDSLGFYWLIPAIALSGVLCYGLFQLSFFQRQERIWQQALDRAQMLALVNLGLAPFLFWWNRMPQEPFFSTCVTILTVCGLLFLIQLNAVLRRLAAMLPDETLRSETHSFTGFNTMVLSLVLGFICVYLAGASLPGLSNLMPDVLKWVRAEALWLTVFVILMPLAITMTLIWKIKEAIFQSVFR